VIDSNIRLVSGAISLTGACTIACKHCYSESGPRVKGTYSLDEIMNIVDALKSAGVGQIFVGGGEPFLHPHLPEIVRFMREQSIVTSVSTNGHAIKSDTLQELYEAGMRHNLSFSLDGPSEPVNARIRGRNSFTRTLLGMYLTSEFGKILWGVNYVSCRLNLGYAVETASLASRLGASYFNCIKFTPSGRGERFASLMELTDDEYFSEIRELRKEHSPFGEYYDDIFVFDVRRRDPSGREPLLHECATSYFDRFDLNNPLGVSINHNGDVAIAPPNIPIGNVRAEPISVILGRINSPTVLAKYEDWLLGKHVGIHPPKDLTRHQIVSK
jgi:MoaA/NifB/PqqE/SkfB family radical SAM enzyme